MKRRPLVLASLAAAIAAPFRRARAAPEKVLRVAMTSGDIPLTTGQPSQGGEGQRFLGLTLYDALINWDLSRRDVPAVLRPGLALSWQVDDATHTVWTFKLRPGVKFHDGTPFDAAAVVWNFDKLMNKDAPQFDPAQAAQGAAYVATVKSYARVDDLTLIITSKAPDAVLPYQLANVYMSGPAQWEKLGRAWEKVAFAPSGTGPWKMDKFVPRTRVELVRNPDYWDPARITKSDRLVLIPVPDATTRVAALLSGQVDWIEAPPPDAVPQLKSSGMQVVTNVYPHIWPYQISDLDGSPMTDLRVRQALNLAIDRVGICTMLSDLATPAKGMVQPSSPWFGTPSFDLRYDPAAARKLLAEAGYGPEKPLKLRIGISTAGSGQMQPLPMNEFIQGNFKDVGVEVSFAVMDWEVLRGMRRAGAGTRETKGLDAINNSWSYTDPDIGLIAASWSKMTPPAGFNWGGFRDAEADALCARAKVAFVPAEQDKILAQLHTRIVDQAMWVWVVHDLNPRGLGSKVRGYVEAQSWYQDLTPVYVDS